MWVVIRNARQVRTECGVSESDHHGAALSAPKSGARFKSVIREPGISWLAYEDRPASVSARS